MQPLAVFSFAAILVGLSTVLLFLGKDVLVKKNSSGSDDSQPIIMTVGSIILLGIFLTSLFIGREFIYESNTTDAVNIVADQQGSQAETQVSSEDLTQLVKGVDKAADDVYNGLETTKKIVGKTEARKEAIAHGRDHASGKLNALADRLQTAAETNNSPNPLDLHTAEHITKGLE
ncbi:hypothetical protein PN498_08490 [Oscillatoria sp. CS-180]|uniref:hypothetical protein n=1 Tax=Oscillatoria sp. CS-180 TaxID=3021720 RepID=UPI0023313D32|nr:hypothetical protein [Oscillatoria sp. CS-180]MDB9526021.1 hypothetical protein [Oscillatoria sp. CS-180]